MSTQSVYVGERKELVLIGNDLVELAFHLPSGGALVSVLDKASGHQFLRDALAPKALFRLGLRPAGEHEVVWLDSHQATHCTWHREEMANGAALVLKVSGFAGRATSVSVRVSLEDGSAFSHWRSGVTDPGAAAVCQITCPILGGVVQVGDPVPGEAIVAPRSGEGMLFRDPYPVHDRLPLKAGIGPDTPEVGLGELHGRYPGGQALQMLLYYNERAGLYLATHDRRQEVKTFDLAPLASGDPHPAFSISHYPSEVVGSDMSLDYDTVVGVFHGDWYDGADIYERWATQQWWCERKLAERDIPAWMRSGFAVFQMSNYHLPTVKLNHSMADIAELVNRLSQEAGTRLLALVFNFEGGGGWTGPIGFFPPREGEAPFRQAMDRLRAAGNLGFLYMPAGNWYIAISSYDPPFDSWPQFEAEGRAHTIMDPSGELPIRHYYGGWDVVRLCPSDEYTGELTASIVLGCIERNAPVVQLDNFPCGGAEACFDERHGHPMGYGPWWSEAWNRILAETRRRSKALDSECLLSVEGICENFIPHLDMYDQRAGNMEYFGHWHRGDPMGGEVIPLFNYVYNEYIGSYCAAYPESNRPEVLYWTRCLGKSLVQGVVPTGGWYFPQPDSLNPVTIGFFKRVARAAARECWPYLMFGKMLRPLGFNTPRIRAPYLKFPYADALDPAGLHFVEDDAVQHSAWRGPDGSLGYIFANVSEEPVAFTVEIPVPDREAARYEVEQIIDGQAVSLQSHSSLPAQFPLRMDPLSVVLIRVTSASHA